MTLCRTNDGRLLRTSGPKAAPAGSEIVEVSALPLADSLLDAVTADKIAGFVAKRREAGLQVSSINRQLEVVRRMLRLAVEWGQLEKQLPPVRKLPGENHRERVLAPEEEASYLDAAPPPSWRRVSVTPPQSGSSRRRRARATSRSRASRSSTSRRAGDRRSSGFPSTPFATPA